MTINYNDSSSTRLLKYKVGRWYYLTVVLSNCVYNGSTWVGVSNLFTLESALHDAFNTISNLHFRGIGTNLVRGVTNSITIGISAGFYNTTADLDSTPAITLRSSILGALSGVSGLVYSQVRVETNMIQLASAGRMVVEPSYGITN